MCTFEPNMREDGAAFAQWLGEPSMQAMIRVAPDRMAQVLGPILRATGQRRPDWFPRRAQTPLFSRGTDASNGPADDVDSCELSDDGLRDRKSPSSDPKPGLCACSKFPAWSAVRSERPAGRTALGHRSARVSRVKPMFKKSRQLGRGNMHAHFVAITYRFLPRLGVSARLALVGGPQSA
jgi:hypothetical protein